MSRFSPFPGWGPRSIGLALLLLLWGGAPPSAPGQFLLPPCALEIEAAEDAYLHQAYEAALDLASGCTRRRAEVPDSTLIRAYRLMGLSFFRQQALGEARTAITHMLSIDPAYTPDPIQDPPSYALLVSMVRDVLRVHADSARLARAVLAADSSGATVPPAPPTPLLGDGTAALEGPSFPLPPSALPFPDTRSNPPATAGEGLLGTSGVRLTLRNQGYERVHGLNLTLWRPRPATSRGGVSGLALGLPTTGAARLKGIGVGLVGVTGSDLFAGVGVGGVGLTAGRLRGLAVGGVGLQVRDQLHGIAATGGLIGGGGSLRGIVVSGLGLSVGGSVGGLQVGGLGVRADDGIAGLTAGLLGASSGGSVSGLAVTGGFLHAGAALRGVHATTGPIVADRVQGLALGSVIVQRSGTGLLLAPLYTYGGPGGTLTGLSLSPVNHVRGRQRGLTIGLFNYATHLSGAQLGLLNYAGNNPRFLRLLPGLNLSF